MVTMDVVQVTIDEVIDVVAMRHGFMAATGAVYMASIVSAALVVRRTLSGVDRVDL